MIRITREQYFTASDAKTKQSHQQRNGSEETRKSPTVIGGTIMLRKMNDDDVRLKFRDKETHEEAPQYGDYYVNDNGKVIETWEDEDCYGCLETYTRERDDLEAVLELPE